MRPLPWNIHSLPSLQAVKMPMLYDDNEVHFLKQVIPEDWKIIKAWLGNNEICVMISPDGKNFTSFDKAMAYVKKQRQQSRRRASEALNP